jgi:MoxR-like ATPase
MNYTIDQIETLILARAGVPLLLSAPGAGKSAIIKDIAERRGMQFIDLRLSQMDSSEVTGLYAKNEKEKSVELLVQKWAILANQRKSIVFFDELNRAERSVRNAALQIFCEHGLGSSFQFNDDVYFVSAGNLGEEDNTDVEEFDDALHNRLLPIKIDVHEASWINQWLAWATSEKGGVHKSITSFIKKTPQALFKKGSEDDKSFATARTWTYFSTLLKANKVTKTEEVLAYARQYLHLYVGGNVSLQFIKHHEDNQKIKLKDVLNNFSAIKDTVKELTRDKISELITELKEKNVQEYNDKQIQNIIDFCKIIDPDEVVALIYGLSENCMVEIRSKDEKGDISKILTISRAFPEIIKKIEENIKEEEVKTASS